MKHCIRASQTGAAFGLALFLSLFLTRGALAQAGTGFALRIDGTGNYVAANHVAAFNTIPLTIMAWVNTSRNTGQQGLVNKYVVGSANGWNLFLKDGRVRAWYFVSNTRNIFGGGDGLDGGFIADGRWHHVAFVVDSRGGTLYVDGIARQSRAWTGTAGSATTTQQVRIGSYPGGNTGFTGSILYDEVAVWNASLSASQVRSIAAPSGLIVILPTGRLAYYQCNEGSGTTVTDSATLGGGNHGVWFSTPSFVSTLPNLGNLAWYRLGENEAGALADQTVTNAIDAVGTRNLSVVGTPKYISATAASAVASVDSTLGVEFNGSNQRLSAGLVTTLTDNFGIEAWVKPNAAVTDTRTIAYNGHTGANGWGFHLTSAGYRGSLGGVTFLGAAAATIGQWTHLALVRDNGMTRFYVNGVASGAGVPNAPISSVPLSLPNLPVLPSGAFAIGARPTPPVLVPIGSPGEFFNGAVDEVRVFTFSPGQFFPANLLVNARRITTLAPSNIGLSNATFNGSANPVALPTTTFFEFGPTIAYGSVTPARALGSGSQSVNFSEVMNGLASGTRLHFRAVASNRLGIVFGTNRTFKTLGAGVETLPATALTQTSATLNAALNPDGLAAKGWFEWGFTTNYGNLTPPQDFAGGTNDVNYNSVLTDLLPAGLFHYRAVGSNAAGVFFGRDETFATLAPPFTALAIPGAVTVKIQPPEAVADGAGWTVDNGHVRPPEMPLPSLTPGIHTVRFPNLPAWIEPTPVDVFVVGGRTSEVSVVFTRVPPFDFREVPEQHVRQGQPIEFLVNGAPPGQPLQVTSTPPPAGALNFDAASGRFTFSPGLADRLPFSLTFSTGGVAAATTTITPLQGLPNEEITINYDRPLPNDESRDYITISENVNPPELFNNVTNETLTVDISGKTLVFDTAHPANLHRQYNGRETIKEFRLFADRVIIRSPLVLPQTHVTIRARELRFEGNGVLDTTPKSLWIIPRAVVWEDDNVIGFPGNTGHNGGDADIFVERFHADPTPAIRFVLRGGDGGSPGEGRDGLFEGRSVEPVFFPGILGAGTTVPENLPAITNWNRLMARAGNSTNCGVANNSLVLYREFLRNGVLQANPPPCGSQTAVAKGEPAVASGIPGAGGRGGTLRSTLDLAAHVSQPGGAPGKPGGNYVGGALVFQYHRISVNTRIFGQQVSVDTEVTQAPKVPGANATAPTGTNGASGTVVRVSDPASWLHSFAARGVVQFAKDAYLNGRDAEARALLAESRDYITALPPAVVNVTNVSDAEFAESTSLDQLTLEIGNLIHRIDSNLDFFGNPAGFAPMLSFEANLIAFQREIDQSIPILYLAYFLNFAATNLQNSLAASGVALDTLRVEQDEMVTALNDTELLIPRLRIESDSIRQRIIGLRARLKALEETLLARAQQNVEEKHKVPFWKKGLALLSVVADLVPVGQPAVGRIGAGLGLLAKIDPDNPIESASKLTNAFNIFENKDIRVCFGKASTNAPGGTNKPPVGNPTPAEGASTNKVAKKTQTKNNTECAKFLQSELKEIAGIFKDVQVDKKEVAAELEKLKAADPVFQQLTKELEQLNKDKERFAQELAVALQAVTKLTSAIAENTLATDNLEERIASALIALDHNALVHIKEMERRAKDRLLTFQYFVAKAFQYRVLQPYRGNLNLNRLLDRFQVLVEANNNHILSQQEFANLKALYLSELRDTVAQTLVTLNTSAPQRALPVQIQISGEDLRRLNNDGELALNLRARGIFPDSHENIRIIDLRTRTLTTRPLGGNVGSFALLFLDYEHLGTSRLNSGGQNFLFRHYQTESVNPITWNTVFDGVANGFSNSKLSPATQSLLSVLLDQPTTDNLLLFAFPAADADLLIRKDVRTDNGIDLAIDSLVIEVEYEFAAANSTRPQLNVVVTEDLEPVITVSQADLNGRRDAQGDFRRIYPPGAVVTLEAPARYGGRAFDRWLINNQPRGNGVTSVTLAMNSALTAEARFAPATAIAPEITQQPQNVTVALGSTASFSAAAIGVAPLAFRWQKNDVPLTDDGRISGAATTTLVIANIVPSDAAEYTVVVTNPVGTQTSEVALLHVTGLSLQTVVAPPGSVGFEFPTIVGLNYIIERTFSLSDPLWIEVQVRPGTGESLLFTRAATEPTAFFRLRVE